MFAEYYNLIQKKSYTIDVDKTQVQTQLNATNVFTANAGGGGGGGGGATGGGDTTGDSGGSGSGGGGGGPTGGGDK